MSNCGIYRILNTSNGKFYIGSSKKIPVRRRQHFTNLRLKKHDNVILQRAYNKDPSKLIFQILVICSPEMCSYYEQICIDKLNPAYNINPYANKPPLTTGISTWNKGLPKEKQPRYGMKYIGPRGENHPSYGKRGKLHFRSKPVMELNTKVIYESASDAARFLKIHRSLISRICCGKLKSSHGYKFLYLE